MLNVAIKAARAAGAIINRAALDVEAVRISQKQVNDFVTEVDHASEAAIIDTLLGAPVDAMHSYLERAYNDGQRHVLHYVTSRELYNIIKAAEAGEQGNPGEYRD